MIPMHPKFAARIAGIVRAKRRAVGPDATARWWEQRFGHLPDIYFKQVMEELQKDGKPKRPTPA
jgi:hypothetical protein